MMDRFNFPYHAPTHVYPKGTSFQFGSGYEFAAAPQGPVQRRFTLNFNGVQWFLNGAGQADATVKPEMNAYALDQFYAAHRTHKAFIYPHPVYGDVICKFAPDAPFEMPKSLPGGSGFTEAFTLVLVEQPL